MPYYVLRKCEETESFAINKGSATTPLTAVKLAALEILLKYA